MAVSGKRGKYWLRVLPLFLLGGALILVAEYIVLDAQHLAHPVRMPVCCTTPADQGFDYETVTLGAAEGISLAGWYIPSHNGAAVILLHGYGSNRVQMLGRAVMLARHGYGVLLYDLRAQGESGGQVASQGWQDVHDVPGALAYLQARPDVDPNRIGLLGFSVGGQVALRAAARLPQIQAVAADGPSLAVVGDAGPARSLPERAASIVGGLIEWTLAQRTGVPRPEGVAQAMPAIAPRPVLLIANALDLSEFEVARRYYALAGEPKDLWAIPDAGHGEGPVVRPAEYEERIVSFFDEALLER